MSNNKRRTLVGVLAALVLIGGFPAAAQASGASDTPASESGCGEIAMLVLEDEGIKASGPTQYLCMGTGIEVRPFADTPNELRIERELRFAGEAQPTPSPGETGKGNPKPFDVPSELSMQLMADDITNCPPNDFQQEIVSELQHFMYACIFYGYYDPNNTAASWSRSIQWEWTLYTGWPSTQNKIRTIPSAGSPTISGSVTSRKQNGWWAPPTDLASSLWKNVGNTTSSGWVVGGMDTTGSHSVRVADVHVKDTAKGYDGYLGAGGGFDSYRFWCDDAVDRCYFPNGEEAGV